MDRLLKVKKAAALLQQGEVLIFPTETVYGLGGSIFCETALKKMYKLKNRPLQKPFIVHIAHLDQVALVAKDIPAAFYKLAAAFFPGPLTIVLPKKAGLSPYLSSFETVALRMPDHSLTCEIIKEFGLPIAGTSANPAALPPPVTCAAAMQFFPQLYAVDGGECRLKQPSTVVAFAGDRLQILRPGSIDIHQLAKISGFSI